MDNQAEERKIADGGGQVSNAGEQKPDAGDQAADSAVILSGVEGSPKNSHSEPVEGSPKSCHPELVEGSPPAFSINPVLILALVLAAGFILRIYGITRESLWLDEGFSIGAARDIFKLMHSASPLDFINSYVDKNPPLYFFLLNFWMKFFGASPFALRFLSLIFGFASLVMIYKIGELYFNRTAGLFASFVMAFNFIQVYYSQEVRYYSLYMLLALCSFYALEKIVQKWELKWAAAYVILTGMLLYTHIHAIFLVAAQNLYILVLLIFSKEFREKFGFKKWIALQGILALIFAPWIRILLIQISDVQKGGWLPVPNHFILIHTLYIFSGSFILLMMFILLSPLSLFRWTKKGGECDRGEVFKSWDGFTMEVNVEKTRQVFLMLLWMLIPLFLPYIWSRVKMPIFHFRYVLAASLPIFILAGAGFSRMKSAGLKAAIVAIIMVISVFNLFGPSDLAKESAREKWREAASVVETQAKPGDLVIVSAGYCLDYIFNYYSRRTDIVKKPFPEYSASPRASRDVILINERDIPELQELVKGHKRIWLVLSHTYDANSLMAREIAKTHKPIFRLPFVNHEKSADPLVIVVYLFEQM